MNSCRTTGWRRRPRRVRKRNDVDYTRLLRRLWKNYLFAGSHEGARRAAMLYSFFASCQRLEVNPRAWLREILERIPDHPVNRLDELLPHRWVEAPAKASTEEE
ncbi:transposase domain-containing protein [Neolewinella litorea]|uniref:Transposase domain-containing protein n=1 Tax=Neolewinella litorea TaxID=2562452 RepID=A0A4S4N573_9BACT|nr:transposase domain-containing protein [Neolewinella litorea]